MEYKGTLKLAQVINKFVCVFVYHINICIFTWKELTKNLASTSVFLPKESLNVNLLICYADNLFLECIRRTKRAEFVCTFAPYTG